jgi:hypothetical protein
VFLVRSQETRYTGDSAFAYTCHACRRCCHDKIIHLNPYEVARLAQNRGIGTTEFLTHYTAAATALKRVEGGACVKGNGFWNRFPSSLQRRFEMLRLVKRGRTNIPAECR